MFALKITKHGTWQLKQSINQATDFQTTIDMETPNFTESSTISSSKYMLHIFSRNAH